MGFGIFMALPNKFVTQILYPILGLGPMARFGA